MSNKLKKKKTASQAPQRRDSLLDEAWGNMRDDLSRFLPDFLTRRLQRRQGNLWLMLVVLLLELVVIGVVGKLIYNWLTA